jgi:hypothetical protein
MTRQTAARQDGPLYGFLCFFYGKAVPELVSFIISI